MALNPYIRENSTYMPIGEARRQNEAVENYRSDGMENEVRGIIYALLMQYAKTDSQNASKRAVQFSKILYEHAVKLINELDINDSVIAKKIVKALDTKISSEIEVLIASNDFENEIKEISGTILEQLETLLKIANGSLVTLSQIGLKSAIGSKATMLKQTESGNDSEAVQYDSTLAKSFIELIQTTESKSVVPNAGNLYAKSSMMAASLQKLASNAITYFNHAVDSFSQKLLYNTTSNITQLKNSIIGFGSSAQVPAGSSAKQLKLLQKPVVKVDPTAELQSAIANLIRNDRFEQRDVDNWMVRLKYADKELSVVKSIVTTSIMVPVKLVSGLFFELKKHIEKTYKEVKAGGFLNYLFSFEGIAVFGTIGYILYRTVFSKVKDSVKDTIIGSIKSSLKTVFGINLDYKKDNNVNNQSGGLFTAPEWISSLFSDEEELSDDDSRLSVFKDLYGWMEDEGHFYKKLVNDFKADKNKGIGWLMDQMTDKDVKDLNALDEYINKFTKSKTGKNMDEWLQGLNNTNPKDKQVVKKEGFFGGFLSKLKTFKTTLKDRLSTASTWFFTETTLGKKINSFWNIVNAAAEEMWKTYGPFVKAVVAVAPLVGTITYVLASPVGRLLKIFGQFGKLVMALCKFEFMKPVIGTIWNLITKSPFAGLLIAGIALGLGVLGAGIWNAFKKIPTPDSSITPYEAYGVMMGLATGQTNKTVAETRFAELRSDMIQGKQLDVSMDALSYLGEGLTKFNMNYENAMKNQNEKQRGTFKWFILNRAKGVSFSNSNWGQVFSEIPILGIGPGLVHSDLFAEFRKSLDSQFGEHSKSTWWRIEQIMGRMKEVDTEFRKYLILANDSQIQNFFNYVHGNKDDVKKIYDWVHNPSGNLNFNLSQMMRKMFMLDNRLEDLPKAMVVLEKTYSSLTSLANYNNSDFSMNDNDIPSYALTIRLGNGKTVRFDDITDPQFISYLDPLAEDLQHDYFGAKNERTTWKEINPLFAAAAFGNYMKRPQSKFRELDPWNLSSDEANKLPDLPSEYRLREIVKKANASKQITQEQIRQGFRSLSHREEYTKLSRKFDANDPQKDTQGMAQVIYILGSILQLCDEMEQ